MDYDLIENPSDDEINTMYEDSINGDLDEKSAVELFYCYVVQDVENHIHGKFYKYVH